MATSISPWKIVSPENFELTLRRLMEPSAEDKMREALAKVMADIESSKTGPTAERRARFHEAEKLRKRKERLERRLAKLQELKEMAVGPLITGLILAGFVWLLSLTITGLGAVSGTIAIQQALQKDYEAIQENRETGLTIEELDENIHVGQRMGIPGGGKDSEGNFKKIDEYSYQAPDYLLEVTKWQPELTGCSETLSLTTMSEPIPGCEASAFMELRKDDEPEVYASCIFLQLGNENGANEEFSVDEQRERFRAMRILGLESESLKPKFFLQAEKGSMDSVTTLWCQIAGTEDDQLAKDILYTVGQIGLRINAQLYLAGGIMTWLESDGSYAPERVWEGKLPSDSSR